MTQNRKEFIASLVASSIGAITPTLLHASSASDYTFRDLDDGREYLFGHTEDWYARYESKCAKSGSECKRDLLELTRKIIPLISRSNDPDAVTTFMASLDIHFRDVDTKEEIAATGEWLHEFYRRYGAT